MIESEKGSKILILKTSSDNGKNICIVDFWT